ncbi:MAG: DUF2092 domain-containing protein [Deltaproteobacteria bacterium]|nr:DUF2092 domain-containing protein [Deltaproteobacteria bacterium]
MSKTSRATALLVAIAWVLFLPSAFAQEPGPAIDPEARKVLKQMGTHIQSLKAFEISSDSTSEYRLDNGMLVERATRTTLVVQRPDRFRGTSVGDDRHQYLYLDGGVLTLYTHKGRYYAQADVPKSVSAGLEYALDEFGIEAPLLDLLFDDASERFVDGVETASYLGKTQVRGVECHQVALRDPAVDVQIWVATGKKPVMRKVVIADRWVTGSPKFTSIMDWNDSPKIEKKTFVFEPPEGSMEIQFTRTGR